MTRPCIQIGLALSTFFYTDGAATPTSHVPCAIHANRRKHTQKKTHTERDEMKTKQLLKISAAPAGVFCALAFFSTATPAAAAQVDYCRTDTSGMRGCGYSSLEQCQAMASGQAPIVTRIHSRRALAPKRAAASRAAVPMPISRSAKLRKAQGSRLSTNRTATARSID
jgi:hypothetical protein